VLKSVALFDAFFTDLIGFEGIIALTKLFQFAIDFATELEYT